MKLSKLAGPERKLVVELVEAGFSREDIKDEIVRKFPSYKGFSNLWWTLFNKQSKAAAKLIKKSKAVKEISINREKVWNDVIALVRENERLNQEVANLRSMVFIANKEIERLKFAMAKANKDTLETIKYRVALANGEINPPLQ